MESEQYLNSPENAPDINKLFDLSDKAYQLKKWIGWPETATDCDKTWEELVKESVSLEGENSPISRVLLVSIDREALEKLRDNLLGLPGWQEDRIPDIQFILNNADFIESDEYQQTLALVRQTEKEKGEIRFAENLDILKRLHSTEENNSE